MTKKLKTKEIKELVALYIDYKRAENAFKRAKEVLCKDLTPGVYSCEDGDVTKTISNRLTYDWKAAATDAALDMTKYSKIIEVETISVRNMR